MGHIDLWGNLYTEVVSDMASYTHKFGQPELKDSGYLLRPRYTPGWVPSWKGTKKDGFLCSRASRTIHIEPHNLPVSHTLQHSAILDATRPSDGTFVTLKCFRQLFEGLQFMHMNRVAHRDCMHLNTMMDASKLYTDAFHPIHPIMKRDFSGFAHFKTRTTQPVKYYFIDFGLSRRYDPSIAQPLEVPIWGGDKEVPEFQNSNRPCDPFPTDIFYIGNMIKKDFVEVCPDGGFEFMKDLLADMTQEDPSKRPNIDEVVARFETIRKSLTPLKLRSRVVDKQESTVGEAFRTVLHWARQLGYAARRLPAIPPPPP
ncbi:hypothetical protein V8B97DRAFT_2025923 [Scleroderma yunnanense]